MRGSPYRAGEYFLGCNTQIIAVAHLGITTTQRWVELRSRHRGMLDDSPYRRNVGLPTMFVHRVCTAISYAQPRGAISIV